MIRLLAFAALLSTSTAAQVRLMHDDLERTAVVHAPADLEGAAPLVIVLHDEHGSNQAFAMERRALVAEAGRRGWVVAFPSGTPCLEGAGACWTSRDDPPSIAVADADDTGFLRSLVAHLRDSLEVDPARVYVTGLGNGGDMAHRLAAQAPDLVAAAAPIVGSVGRSISKREYTFSMAPTPTAPVPMLTVKGMKDTVYPYHGSGPTYDALAAAYDANFWAEANGCDLEDVERVGTTFIADRLDGDIATHDYRVGCREGATVRLVAVGSLSHAWPTTADGYDADLEVVAFFAQHAQR